MTFKSYIKHRKQNHFRIKNIDIVIKDPVQSNINVASLFQTAFDKVPENLLKNIEIIYIGDFEHLKDRDMQAAYENSSIFMQNTFSSEEEAIDDIVHEISHSVEELYSEIIYSDGKLEKEFERKRKELWFTLDQQGFKYDLTNFLNLDYDRNFDEMLYMEIGYPMLSIMTVNTFISPYGATSLREYFANGFEAFFMKEDIPRIKNISPELYKKLIKLLNISKGEI